eukprot:CAMPEP_0173214988 /NCGR_PEP_ID=MMETSP1141-20130122/26247_1 /TAXON_ID=483371 /ORGANISM="non described non described, Strain CCMP2298" /LENGTH=132 /DNA_ID=CAMNT_0014142351 /DNA_START=277 /DNA_END=675 /DNA_ORIENTATION=+
MASGFTVSRSGPKGHPFTVQSIHMGVCLHVGIDIGDIFYKDGDIEVKTYTTKYVTAMLRTATAARQATFSFLTPAQTPALLTHAPLYLSALSTSAFTVERSQMPGRPYIVRTIRHGAFRHAGKALYIRMSFK